MRILQVVPTYPGDVYDGSAVFQRALNRAMQAQGATVEVLTTRSQRLVFRGTFAIGWPNELPSRAEHDGVLVRRFRALDTTRLGPAIDGTLLRQWSREDTASGIIDSRSAAFAHVMTRRARQRRRRIDVLGDVGRGPLVPALVARVARVADRYDVILAGYSPFSLPRQVLFAAQRSGTPVVLLPFIHEDDRYHHFRSLYETYERAEAVLTLSSHTADHLGEYVPAADATAIGAGIDPELPAATDEVRTAFRVRHGLDGVRVLLFVGRKESSKRYDLAVTALEHLPGDVVLLLVGKDVDETPIVTDRVRVAGIVSDAELAAAYELADVLIFPSEHESFGMVVLEAWLRGKPVIANARCGASATLIDDGVDGILCHNARSFAAGARRLLDDPDLAARMGDAGRRKALAEYTWADVATRALDAMRAVVR